MKKKKIKNRNQTYDMDDRNKMSQSKKKKKKKKLSTHFYWIVLLISCIVFMLTFFRMPMFPKSWKMLVLFLLAILLIGTGIFTSAFRKSSFQKSINIVLSLILFVGSVLLPYEEAKVSSLFNALSGNVVRINLYVMKQEYRDAHSDLFTNAFVVPEEGDTIDIANYADARFGSMVSVDLEDQNYALKEINEKCGKTVQVVDRETIGEAAEQLYHNHVDIMIMADSYASVLSDMAGYETFEQDTQIIGTIERTIQNSAAETVKVPMTRKPFTIFIGGNDQTGSLSLKGRTDVDMTVTVNPNTHQIAMINLPRDSFIPNPEYDGELDKLTHLGLSGLDNTMKGIGEVLDVDVQNYILVNFDTFMMIIDALDGITIENPYAFKAIDGQFFDQGPLHLNSVQALMYVRERKNLPDGDFGRNMHQQIVLEALIDKITSPDGILAFNKILNQVKDYFLTNIASDSMYALIQKQLDEKISWNIVKYHIEGTTGMEYCASVPGQALSVVYPYPNQIAFAKRVVDAVVDGDILTQEEMPEGSFNTDSDTDS